MKNFIRKLTSKKLNNLPNATQLTSEEIEIQNFTWYQACYTVAIRYFFNEENSYLHGASIATHKQPVHTVPLLPCPKTS